MSATTSTGTGNTMGNTMVTIVSIVVSIGTSTPMSTGTGTVHDGGVGGVCREEGGWPPHRLSECNARSNAPLGVPMLCLHGATADNCGYRQMARKTICHSRRSTAYLPASTPTCLR